MERKRRRHEYMPRYCYDIRYIVVARTIIKKRTSLIALLIANEIQFNNKSPTSPFRNTLMFYPAR